MSGELADIRCDRIDPSPDQNREVFDPAKLAELAGSIRATGLLQPVRVRPVKVPGYLGASRYVLIAGERRLRACRDILGWESIPAVVDDGPADPLAAAIGTLAENMIRADPGPIEEARGLLHVLELGSTPAELAAQLGKSARWVRDRLCLLELAEDVAHWVQSGHLPIKWAILMTELDVNRQRLALKAHESGIKYDAFRLLCGRLADEQAADSMFSPDDFLRVDEYVIDAEAAAVLPAQAVVKDVPLGVNEIGELLKVKPATVHQWRVRGQFPEMAGRCGGSPYWYETDVLAWAVEFQPLQGVRSATKRAS